MKVINYDLNGNIVKVKYRTKNGTLFDEAMKYTNSFEDALSLETNLEQAEEEAKKYERE